jgi:alpha-tubulin suppressor-like RCC1 family protein
MTSGGGVQCWGANGSGQVGNNSTIESHVPVPVSGLASGVIAIAAGGFHTCALTGGGSAQCWGANDSGELGNDSSSGSNVPVAVTGLGSGVSAIAAGVYHTCALTSGGGAQCWGDNVFGELGNNSTFGSNVPVPVSGLGSGVTAIAPGGNHTCTLTSGGGVQCWGLDTSGQLGDGSTSTSLAPVTAVLDSAVAIAVGWFHSCALIGDGRVQCWGDNTYGELGNKSTTNTDGPADVTGLGSGVIAIAAGGNHTCALTSGGGVQCWGSNTYGELGNNSTTNSSVPVAVLGLGSGVTAIAAGRGHTCAQTRVRTVQCWGDNEYGQLGNNSTTNSSVPVAVVGF